jgi:hypothetical protein
MDFGNRLRYGLKARYSVNQLQMSQTDTTDYEGERESVGYGQGFSDPHQGGYMGETATNKEPLKRKRVKGYGFG